MAEYAFLVAFMVNRVISWYSSPSITLSWSEEFYIIGIVGKFYVVSSLRFASPAIIQFKYYGGAGFFSRQWKCETKWNVVGLSAREMSYIL